MAQSSWSAKQWLVKHRFILIYTACAGVLLVLLNIWLWPTPDEYFYALLAHSFAAAQQGVLQWYNISTEHIAVLSGLVWLWQYIWPTTVFWEQRLVMIPFALGIIWLVAAIGKRVLPRDHEHWMLWLLLLIPGFWIFSVRLMLDIPSTFAIALLLYLLIARKPSLYVGAAVVNLLLFREYYVYFMLPFVLFIYLIDACRQPGDWWSAIVRWCLRSAAVIIPVALVTILFLDFNYLPYPRLFENSLIFIFGDIFRLLNYQVVGLMTEIAHTVDPTINFWPSTITSGMHDAANAAVVMGNSITQVADIHLTGQVPTGIVQSQITAEAASIWNKLWLIYYYNFSEADLHVLLLPLAVLGMVVRARATWSNWAKQYLRIRADLLYFGLLAVFAYFNYHEATSVHGFRITLPVILALLYFAYWGAATLMHQPKRWQQVVFILLAVGSIAGYWATIQSVYYGSVLAQDAILAKLLLYKPYIFIVIFFILTILIVLYPIWQWRYKLSSLAAVIVVMFVVKLLPFAFDAYQSQQLYGYDYGLSGATAALQQVMTPTTKLCGNLHAYRSQYYAEDPIVTNDGVAPLVRSFSQRYPQRYYYCAFDDQFASNLVESQINYVFVLNGDVHQTDYQAWEVILAANPDRFALISESTLNGRAQWALYKVNP